MRTNASLTCDRFTEFPMSEVFVVINKPFCSPDWLIVRLQVLTRERSCREKRHLPDSDLWFLEIVSKISPAWQERNCLCRWLNSMNIWLISVAKTAYRESAVIAMHRNRSHEALIRFYEVDWQ